MCNAIRLTIELSRPSYFFSETYCGGYSGEDPPLPIPNREVKLTIADGTAPPGGRVGSRLFKPSPIRARFFCISMSVVVCCNYANSARLESAATADLYVTHPPK